MSVISGESKFGLDIGAMTGGILVWREGRHVKRKPKSREGKPVGGKEARQRRLRPPRSTPRSTISTLRFVVSADGQHFIWSAGQFDVALADGMREPLGSTVQTLCGR
jgi:hypothetical protein